MSASDPVTSSGTTGLGHADTALSGSPATPSGAPPGHAATSATAPAGPPSDASLSDLISRLGDDVTTLFRQEVELAKAELKREATAAGKAAGLLGAGGVLGHVALLLLAWAAAWGLAEVVPTAVAFLLVGVIVAVAAAVLAAAGRKRMQRVDPTPRATIETLKEDKQVLTDRSGR